VSWLGHRATLRWLALWPGCLGILWSGAAWANTPYNPAASDHFKAAELAADATSTHGWKSRLSLGLNGAWAQSSDVPGAPDGSTVQLGTLIDASLERVRRRWSWLNGVKLQYGLTRTPLLERFIKSQDMLDAASTFFLRAAHRKTGFYGRTRATTAVTDGYLIRPTAATLARRRFDGAVVLEPLAAQEQLPLTKAWEPLLFAEGVGLFLHPTETEGVTVRLRAGVGAQQSFAQGGYILADDPKTEEIELRELRSASQLGAEAELAAEGRYDDHLSWRAKVSWFLPVWTNRTDLRSGIGALQTDLTLGASYKLAKALSIDWQSTFRKVPVVVDVWQVTHALLLTAGLIL
jgi:hypothetical protein